MITNKLFNFPKIIFENIFSSANRVWIELISNLFLVLIAAIITIAIILYKQRKALKKIDVLSKIENELSNNFLNELPVYFVALNADGTTRYMNRTMLNSLGYQEKDVLHGNPRAENSPARGKAPVLWARRD